MEQPCPHCDHHVSFSSLGEKVTCSTCSKEFVTGEQTRILNKKPISDEFKVGDQVGRFRLTGRLGRGGMGVVYKAEDPTLKRTVAVKILNTDLSSQENFIKRFDREAAHLAKLKHPGIVQVMDRGIEQGRPYLVMDYIDGVTLRHEMSSGPMPLERAQYIIECLGEILDYSHKQGVIHRDIKPENILIDSKNNRPLLTDFGLSKTLQDHGVETRLTMTNVMMGTLDYMAPEQRRGSGPVDTRTDLYSLGVVFYEMLTGGLPVGVFELPSKKIGTPQWVDHIILRLLDKNPDQRFRSAQDVIYALKGKGQQGQQKQQQSAKPTPTPQSESLEIHVGFDWWNVAIAVTALFMVFGGLPFSWMLCLIIVFSGIKNTQRKKKKGVYKGGTFLGLRSGTWIALITVMLIFQPWNHHWTLVDQWISPLFHTGSLGEVRQLNGMDRLINETYPLQALHLNLFVNMFGLVVAAILIVGLLKLIFQGLEALFKFLYFIITLPFKLIIKIVDGAVYVVFIPLKVIRDLFDNVTKKKPQGGLMSNFSSYHDGTKYLRRDTANALLGGVCSGIALHFGWNPGSVRLAWVLMVLFGGIGILPYIILWVVIPRMNDVSPQTQTSHYYEGTSAQGHHFTQSNDDKIYSATRSSRESKGYLKAIVLGIIVFFILLFAIVVFWGSSHVSVMQSM